MLFWMRIGKNTCFAVETITGLRNSFWNKDIELLTEKP